MSVRKLLLVCLLMVFSGWTGFYFGEQRLKFSYANWKAGVVVNKEPILAGKPANIDFSQFWTVWDLVSTKYVDKATIDPKKMVDGAISGMVASLGDPYTVYLPIPQNKASKEDLGGEFEGVGIQLGFDKNNYLSVVTPIDESPAAKAGVKSGDIIVHIKDAAAGVDQATDGMTLPAAVNLIRGKKGTHVLLTLVREGVDKPFVVDLARDTIVVKSVTVEFKENAGKKIAWIKLSRFGDLTEDEWNNVVTQIVTTDTKGVIVDVRNNPGGYLEGAVYIAGEFLPAGKLVVSQQSADGSKIDNKVIRNGRLLTMPTVVIVNKGSASAAEIFSGALQDYKRAKIVGVQSFGKGSVQQPEDFPDGSGIHITIAKWLRPSGAWIHKIGITPDVVVAAGDDVTKDPQLDKALGLF
jgi:carboxyl-terminal processing protease